MIRIYATKRGEKYRLLVQGHAEKEGEGRLVCAAVSALTGALVGFARACTACKYVRSSLSHGNVFLSCHFGLQDAFFMTLLALQQLADAYPMHLCVCSTQGAVNDSRYVGVL